METYLDFMRVAETYHARRLLEGPFNFKLDLLMCPDSAEKYLHMSAIEDEKRAFKVLIDAKPNLVLDRRDLELESQVRALRQDTNTRHGGLPQNL